MTSTSRPASAGGRGATDADGIGTGALMGLGFAVAAVVVGTIFTWMTKAFFTGFFDGLEGEDLSSYLHLLDNRALAWRMALILAVGITCRQALRRMPHGEFATWFGSALLSSVLLANWHEYQVFALCGSLMLCVNTRSALALWPLSIIVVSGFLTRGLLLVPFGDTVVTHPTLHIIGIALVAFWMTMFLAAGGLLNARARE